MERRVSSRPVLAVIPARGGSKGLAGKNIRPLAGLPLITHSLRCAAMSECIDRVVVSTDSEAIAEVARAAGGWVPFLRPPELATDSAPIWPVIQHALTEVERLDGRTYASVLLLDPTSPGRLPADIDQATSWLDRDSLCDGVVGVSVPEFNPLWHCVVEENGYMRSLIAGAEAYQRRQDVPIVYRINATLYCWRRDFVRQSTDWRTGHMRMVVVPEARAVHIDDIEQFELVELRLRQGLLHFPWLDE